LDVAFRRLRSDGRTSQRPSLLWRNWEGRTTASGEFLLPPTPAEEQLAVLLDGLLTDGPARTACTAALTQRMPVVVPVSVGADDPTAQQIVTAAARVPHGVATLLDLLTTGPELPADTSGAVRQACAQLRSDEFLTYEEHAQLLLLLSAASVPDPAVTALHDRRLRHHVAMSADTTALVRSIEAAGRLRDAGWIPPLLRFTSLMAAETKAQVGHDCGLVDWSRRVARRTGHTDALAAHLKEAWWEACRRRSDKAWLLVHLEVDDPEAPTGCARYTHAAWLVHPTRPRPQVVRDRRRPATWRHTQLALAELIEPLIDARPDAAGRIDLGVEFFLPHSQLELQVERVPLCHRGVDNVPLGSIATVVVRCAQRRTAWHQRWDACNEDVAAGPQHWLRQDAGDLTALKEALSDRPTVGCVELTGSCAEFTPALAHCTEAGVPVMTWHRRIGEERPVGDDLADLRAAHPRQLPDEVRQLRGETDTASSYGRDCLVLLWDDPGRLPPRRRPRNPGRIQRP
jgi:hypothetical protein